MDWMLFYQERTGTAPHFLFNGEAMINILPNGAGRELWPSDNTDQYEADKDLLATILKSKRKTFTLRGRKYIITLRGKFIRFD